MVQIYADFSGKDILVALFQLQRPLEIVRINSEEMKTWTAFCYKMGFFKSAKLTFNSFPIYFYTSVASCEGNILKIKLN